MKARGLLELQRCILVIGVRYVLHIKRGSELKIGRCLLQGDETKRSVGAKVGIVRLSNAFLSCPGGMREGWRRGGSPMYASQSLFPVVLLYSSHVRMGVLIWWIE